MTQHKTSDRVHRKIPWHTVVATTKVEFMLLCFYLELPPFYASFFFYLFYNLLLLRDGNIIEVVAYCQSCQ